MMKCSPRCTACTAERLRKRNFLVGMKNKHYLQEGRKVMSKWIRNRLELFLYTQLAANFSLFEAISGNYPPHLVHGEVPQDFCLSIISRFDFQKRLSPNAIDSSPYFLCTFYPSSIPNVQVFR